ncbi:MAG: hypothetical protein AAGA96_07240 [Verrucomicrobiota bacterium]
MADIGDEIPDSKRSISYVVGSSVLSAFILGATIFFLVRGFQWNSALNDLRAEPGIEVMRVERLGLVKRRLVGLKDPLAPSVENLLRKNGIAPHTVQLDLADYHSLNTPYSAEREAQRARETSDLKNTLIEANAEFTEAIHAQRNEDIDRMTRLLFESKFPEAMESIDLTRTESGWKASGELYAPLLNRFVDLAPNYTLGGSVDTSGLVDLTYRRLTQLSADISRFNLFDTDLDGHFVHVARMGRLVEDYDEICDQSELPRPSLRLEIHSARPESLRERIEAVRSQLHSEGNLAAERFQGDAFVYAYSDDGPSVNLFILTPSSP